MFIYEQKVGYLNELLDMFSEKKIFHCMHHAAFYFRCCFAVLLVYYWFISYIRTKVRVFAGTVKAQ